MSLFDSLGTFGNKSLSRWNPEARTARSWQFPNEATIVQKWQMRNSLGAGNYTSWEQIFLSLFSPSLWNLLGNFILISKQTVNTIFLVKDEILVSCNVVGGLMSSPTEVQGRRSMSFTTKHWIRSLIHAQTCPATGAYGLFSLRCDWHSTVEK